MTSQFHYSSVLHAIIAVVGGLGGLAIGGEILVKWSARLARRLGMGALLIGLTVVAFGTSVPELFVSLSALSKGLPELMVGNIIGSNTANVGLILGLAALLRPFSMPFKAVSLELYLVLVASLTLMGLTMVGYFFRPVGFLFVFCIVLYTYCSYAKASKGRKQQEVDPPKPAGENGAAITIMLTCIVFGLALLAVGSDYFIEGAEDLARRFGVSDLVIGLTLAAVGTSLPELASSFAAVRQGQEDILVGNIVGSNLFNLLMVMGACAVYRPFSLPEALLFRDLPVMTGFSFFLLPALGYCHGMNRWLGLILLGAYGGYIYALA